MTDALPLLPEPAQEAQSEGYMTGCPTPIPATPDFYTAEQMRAMYEAGRCVALAARLPLTEAQREVLMFLWGAGTLDGLWWGEAPAEKRGQFWWRKHLTAAFPELAAAPTAQQGEHS